MFKAGFLGIGGTLIFVDVALWKTDTDTYYRHF